MGFVFIVGVNPRTIEFRELSKSPTLFRRAPEARVDLGFGLRTVGRNPSRPFSKTTVKEQLGLKKNSHNRVRI